jgi:F-type H+/Na+-transporting ATPase subunit beta
MSNIGKIVQVIGPVVDVDFSASANCLRSTTPSKSHYDLEGKQARLVCEVQQHLGDGWVRSVAMISTEGLKRGMTSIDTGAPITVPVGEELFLVVFSTSRATLG